MTACRFVYNNFVNDTNHNAVWERRQTELWDRIFQATEDVISLADSLADGDGASVVREKMVESAMLIGRHVVRAMAAGQAGEFEHYIQEARLQAIETDYWLRLTYVVQQREDVQHDLSSVIAQYSSIIELLQKLVRHVGEAKDTLSHMRGPKVSL